MFSNIGIAANAKVPKGTVESQLKARIEEVLKTEFHATEVKIYVGDDQIPIPPPKPH